ncbi:hypothetical protein J2129_000584 [Methanofollis sp. W23]|uniref:hypothetical protein n=1 Tax=Methanofollis sp. W23 TaxID=2817849 RepID=UPI001AE72BF8|nr:hypothetical protein [Methanofollis sp. W23]MBP2145130.1 hypothetical protein [Methanofollis sp. W23]
MAHVTVAVLLPDGSHEISSRGSVDAGRAAIGFYRNAKKAQGVLLIKEKKVILDSPLGFAGSSEGKELFSSAKSENPESRIKKEA